MEKLARNGHQHLSFSEDFREVIYLEEGFSEPQHWRIDQLNRSLFVKAAAGKIVLQYATDFDEATQQLAIKKDGKIHLSANKLVAETLLLPAEDQLPVFAQVSYNLNDCAFALKYQAGPFPLHIFVIEGNYALKTAENASKNNKLR